VDLYAASSPSCAARPQKQYVRAPRCLDAPKSAGAVEAGLLAVADGAAESAGERQVVAGGCESSVDGSPAPGHESPGGPLSGRCAPLR
jgi:hypothetical protein